MRATVFPGEDPMTLDTPEQVADSSCRCVRLNGARPASLYDYKTRTLMGFRGPA